ncbi:stage III sporulation protein AH [Bacillus sp. ISL-34]|uniref:stage III sporulation protein AH n=1 Tax=Bacillus sp. ISL-34 TaxID=2819121 RepID=UPI001BEB5E9E|nr:stage III sporulation protein AH [Bacillus sp. ISL-34]MBT2645134.1 stage III sporulation protein AH [Bacillus sp. ISL-34]
MLSVESNPKNKVYLELIVLCFEVCDEFHLVIRTDMGAIKDLEEIINKFKASFKEMRCESTRASTTLGDNQTANVYYFYADRIAKSLIKMIAKSLYQWEMPNLPEDLSFFKQGKVWLATSSHKKQIFIFPE